MAKRNKPSKKTRVKYQVIQEKVELGLIVVPNSKIGITRKSHEQSKKKRLMAKRSKRINRGK